MSGPDDQAARDAALRQAVEHMADQLCLAVDQKVDFVVRSPLASPVTVQESSATSTMWTSG